MNPKKIHMPLTYNSSEKKIENQASAIPTINIKGWHYAFANFNTAFEQQYIIMNDEERLKAIAKKINE